MKFGIVIAGLIFLVSCDRRAQLKAANEKSRQLLAARINNNVQSRLGITFNENKTGFQTISAPKLSEEQNQSKIQAISNNLVKKIEQIKPLLTQVSSQKSVILSPPTPIKQAQTIQFSTTITKPVQVESKKEETVQPILFSSISKQTIPIVSTVPTIQSKIKQAQIPYFSTPSKPQQILISSTTNVQPQSSLRQVEYPIQGTNLIRGINNQVLGQQNILDGNRNKIDGNQNIAIGHQNDIKGMRNDVTASNAIVKGNKNVVTESIDVSNLF